MAEQWAPNHNDSSRGTAIAASQLGAASVAGAQQLQQQQQQLERNEQGPDLSGLTVMQRYHHRRKQAMQRLEQEVVDKLAQVRAACGNEGSGTRMLRWG